MGRTTIKRRTASRKSAVLIMKRSKVEKKPTKRPFKLEKRDLLRIFFIMIFGFLFLTKGIYYLQNRSEIPIVKNIIEPKKINVANKEASLISGYKKVDSELQKSFEQFIDEMYSSGKIETEERAAWLAYDLINKEMIISVNADLPMQCASMVKPFVALAFFHQVSKGKLVYTDQSKRLLRMMLQHSWNTATNWFMRQVGGPKAVNDLLYENYPDIFQQTSIVEYIPPGGLTYKNMASASDYNRFLISMWKGEIPYADEIREFMSLARPGRSGEILPDTEVSHKSGTTARMCGDMAILQSECKTGCHAYTFVGIIDRDDSVPNYLRWRRIKIDVIREASSMIYDAMKKAYGYS